MNELAPSAFWFTFDSLLIYMCIDQAWGQDGWILAEFFFFFSFLRFYGPWQVKVQKNAKKRNDANIQLSWPNEQYEFDIMRIKNDLFILRNGKEIEVLRKIFVRLVTSVGQRKNSESPWGIEPQTFGYRAPMLYHWATETPRWARGLLRSSYDTRPTYC